MPRKQSRQAHTIAFIDSIDIVTTAAFSPALRSELLGYDEARRKFHNKSMHSPRREHSSVSYPCRASNLV
jgi:hypothetical protein